MVKAPHSPEVSGTVTYQHSVTSQETWIFFTLVIEVKFCEHFSSAMCNTLSHPFCPLELTMWIFGEEYSTQCCKIFKPEFYKFLMVHHVKSVRGTVAIVCNWMFVFISAL